MINLHDVVRPVIPILHPDENVVLVQSTGDVNVRGIVTPTWATPETVVAQIQSMGADELKAQTDVSVAGEQRKCWLYSDTAAHLTPDGIVRPLARGGDLIRRADGSWWYVAGLQEDFTASGWVSVHIAQQITVPEAVLELVEAWEHPDDDGGDEGDGEPR